MYLNCHISITIGNKAIQTVMAVKTKNEAENIGSECDITVPINCRIQYKDGTHDYLTDQPRVLFNVGDAVAITAWCDGYPVINVFTGYVYDIVEGMPCVIKCLDELYNLKKGILNLHFASISFKDLVDNYVLKGTGISLMLPTLDFNLVDITFPYMSPAGILQYFKKELHLCISLMGKQLYANIASNTLQTVIHRTDTNVVGAKLQRPGTAFQLFQVRATFLNANGTKSTITVGDTKDGQIHEVTFNKVAGDMAFYTKLANEALVNVQKRNFKGEIKTPLYPDCGLYWMANYTSIRYPDQNGTYQVMAHDFELDDKGFFRNLRYTWLVQPLTP
jgi:hypothetical protein